MNTENKRIEFIWENGDHLPKMNWVGFEDDIKENTFYNRFGEALETLMYFMISCSQKNSDKIIFLANEMKTSIENGELEKAKIKEFILKDPKSVFPISKN